MSQELPLTECELLKNELSSLRLNYESAVKDVKSWMTKYSVERGLVVELEKKCSDLLDTIHRYKSDKATDFARFSQLERKTKALTACLVTVLDAGVILDE